MRSCTVCRQKTDKRNLYRIVRTPEAEVVFDPTGKKNGRGAYVCSQESCLELVKNKKRIASALNVESLPDDVLVRIKEDIISHLLTKQ